MKNLSSVLLAGLSSLIVLNTYAQPITTCCPSQCGYSRACSASFTAGVGYDFFSSRRHIENTWVPFIGAGYNFTDHWGIDAILGNFNTNHKKNVTDDRQVQGTIFAIDAIYHFTPYKNVEPYILAGMGIAGFKPNGVNAHNEGNINAGLGVNIFTTQAVAFRFEARDFYSTVGGRNDVMLDGGVLFLWC